MGKSSRIGKVLTFVCWCVYVCMCVAWERGGGGGGEGARGERELYLLIELLTLLHCACV